MRSCKELLLSSTQSDAIFQEVVLKSADIACLLRPERYLLTTITSFSACRDDLASCRCRPHKMRLNKTNRRYTGSHTCLPHHVLLCHASVSLVLIL